VRRLSVVSEFEDQARPQALEGSVSLSGLVKDVGAAPDALPGSEVQHLPLEVVGFFVKLVRHRLREHRSRLDFDDVRATPVPAPVQDQLADARRFALWVVPLQARG